MAVAVIAAALIIAPNSSNVPSPHDLTAGRNEASMSEPSIDYRGAYYRSNQSTFALCVLKRESNAHWFSTNRSHGYFGGFQFSQALARGASFMITPELKNVYGKTRGKEIARILRGTEMHKWRPYFQQMAFFTVLNWDGNGSGASHWAGGRWRCSL